MTFKEFIIKIGKRDQPRNHKVKNSLGIVDAYQWCKKNNKTDLDLHTFRILIRTVNKQIIKEYLNNHNITFPYRMGNLIILKKKRKIINKAGYVTKKVDWYETLKMWYSDQECKKEKKLYKKLSPYMYKLEYEKRKAVFKNKMFYKFLPNRQFLNLFGVKMKENKLDGYNKE